MMHYKAAKASEVCPHTHATRPGAAACVNLAPDPGVVVCLGPGGKVRVVCIQPRLPEERIRLEE